ncbi:flagellar biosynthesis anti-sigma factor FlgM [Geomesophilobacter sediminis]|uniref:Negative regulator of flagellin synthesis n=1 Tax=Geomesophilobacter sediminis TaxID=2798584 RepID=A0A8J7IN91_9BACT|nr:flagellar biosynthesis anti-sigma factor FlgM [Geomesophilobacter sediminis]MBJ6723454.1 flagellar biosynthesis anti-sigma factor FlgM [Geomesophilobacter sediminis]
MKVAEIAAGSNVQPVQTVAADKHEAAAAAQRADAQKATDKVELSKKSLKVAETEAPKEASPERLAKLKALIESGKYHVPAMEVAAKMVSYASHA